ncbi:MBL fold metallo-hydrolase [Solicola gregarius]|uniref:MBL fold metallo-hydrolase n=1 Tax=Solicola gregarius TaxID=2908642 RepID=A0AA46TMP3_9ACTN|nr:MBL fold metallo-hydrolase [Solicola gregarius]UYM07759.1 MBL fold metallo-hydrolase [Solicola gregarius]
MTWSGGRFGERAECVLAHNPGIMTLDGTNTWVLREVGAARSIVVDPGPPEPEHLDAVEAAAGSVGVVLLTHRHIDHSESAAAFASRVGCEVRAADASLRTSAAGLNDGDRVEVDGLVVEAVATPGHTSDSVSLLVGADSALLTGDTVLGRGTSVVAQPDGDLGAYLDSLRRLRRLVDERGVRRLLPGHGPVIENPAEVLDGYLTHRAERLEQVRAAVAEGASTAREVVERVYADVDESLWPAAEQSVAAQLAYLRR